MKTDFLQPDKMGPDGVKFNTSVVFLTKIVVACVIFIPGFSPCGGY